MGRDTHSYLVWMRDQLRAERWYHENEPEPDSEPADHGEIGADVSGLGWCGHWVGGGNAQPDSGMVFVCVDGAAPSFEVQP